MSVIIQCHLNKRCTGDSCRECRSSYWILDYQQILIGLNLNFSFQSKHSSVNTWSLVGAAVTNQPTTVEVLPYNQFLGAQILCNGSICEPGSSCTVQVTLERVCGKWFGIDTQCQPTMSWLAGDKVTWESVIVVSSQYVFKNETASGRASGRVGFLVGPLATGHQLPLNYHTFSLEIILLIIPQSFLEALAFSHSLSLCLY